MEAVKNNFDRDYRNYEKIMKIKIEQPIDQTAEYQSFSDSYPHIAESIKLKREVKNLKNELESEKKLQKKIKIRQKIYATQKKLKKTDLFKRLRGEKKTESLFQKKFKQKNSKKRYSIFVKKIEKRVRKTFSKFRKNLRRTLHKKMPPTVFYLKELNVSERGRILREWLKEKS